MSATSDPRGDFEHRLIPAAGAPSVLPRDPVVSPFVSWRRDGSATASTEEPAAATHEEKTMPKPTRQASATSIRMRVCRALAGSAMHRQALAATLSDLETKQLTQNLFMANKDKLVDFHAGDDGLRMYRLTAKGRKYVEGAPAHAGGAAPAPAAKKARAAKKVPAKRAKPGQRVRRPRAATAPLADKPPALAVATFEPELAHSFRCGLHSDGSFHLFKGEAQISLTLAESRQMLRYLDRLRDDATA